MPDTLIHKSRDGRFEYGFTADPDDFIGTMEPWSPHWWAQYQGDGTQGFFDTRAEMREWMQLWREIDS